MPLACPRVYQTANHHWILSNKNNLQYKNTQYIATSIDSHQLTLLSGSLCSSCGPKIHESWERRVCTTLHGERWDAMDEEPAEGQNFPFVFRDFLKIIILREFI